MSPDTPGADPVERILDVAVFAPLGLVLRALDAIPRLATEGRERFHRQAPTARMIGQMAVVQGRRKVESLRRQVEHPPEPRPGGLATAPSTDVVPAPEGAIEAGPAGTLTGAAEPVLAADLPIPGYDSLSASQVVQRLAGLSPEELDAVRAYELAGRGRKTVLLRVAQLRAAT